jgi:capsular exopolysaccharide synthesis family protein
VTNASRAEATAGFPRLFDLGESNQTSKGSIRVCTLGDLADRRLIVHPDADPVYVEQHRRLGAALHHAQAQDGIRGVMVASAVAAEGKTLSATNLALMLSGSFTKRVLLVDGDLRKPSVHELLQLDNDIGLSDLLERPGGRLPAHTLSPTLSVITAGHHHSDPVSLLTSDAAGHFLAETREQFDWVVVDTPPAVLFPDAELFARHLDACVMVVRAATTPSPVAAGAIAAIGASHILGVVLNRAEATEIAAGYGYGSYGYYAAGERPRRYLDRWRSSRA